MPQVGGPAAINGFLYQILQHLGWIAKVSLTGNIADGALASDASLVLEPKNGGDARVEYGAHFIVEQYKSRDNGTWSVNTIINDVLRDLRKAVPAATNRIARFRFVTDGRPGKLANFEAFLAEVRSVNGPDALDNHTIRIFADGLPTTFKGLFDHIVDRIRPTTDSPGIKDCESVFRLLVGFEMEFEAKANLIKANIEKVLRNFVPDLGDEKGIREHIVGALVERLATGEVHLGKEDIDELFKKVRLDPERLRNLACLADTMERNARDRLRQLQYRADADVRSAPEWPKDKFVLLISGESGYGKTWLLGKLVLSLLESRSLATLIFSSGSAKDQIQRAADDVWQVGLASTSQKTLDAVNSHYRDMVPNTSEPWLTVAIDDVQDLDVARKLIRNDWQRLGVRLVMTVPSRIVPSLELGDGESIHVHKVDQFSIDELDDYLTRQGRSYIDLPSDLKKLLQTPILAGLYVSLPYESFQLAPRSEYEIFEQFWKRISIRSASGDDGILLAIGEHVFNEQTYPVTRTAWQDIGAIEAASIQRLESVGWIRCAEGGVISFAHDRLLNWAVAVYFARRIAREPGSITAIVGFLEKRMDFSGAPILHRLSYVAMDLFWLLLADGTRLSLAAQLLKGLEAIRLYGSYGDDLYTELLPTIGGRAIPLLLHQLDQIIEASEGDYRVGLIAKGLVAIAVQQSVDLSDSIKSLLASQSIDRQSVAIEILAITPDKSYLDRLWELHLDRTSRLNSPDGPFSIADYQASSAAMRKCVELAPEWLQKEINRIDAQTDGVSELAFKLKTLDHADAPNIWLATREMLFAKVRSDQPRCLLQCVGRFKDQTKIDFVLSCLVRREDHANGVALSTLVLLNPELAIEKIVDVEESDRYSWRNSWLPSLLHSHPEETHRRILEIAEPGKEGRTLIDTLFAERANELDQAMLSSYLRWFEMELVQRVDPSSTRELNWLSRPLDFLASLTRPDLLRALEHESGTDFETVLSRVACDHVPVLSRAHDHIFESLKRVLMLIGGTGITRLMSAMLAAKDYWGRHDALLTAYMYPNANLIGLLAACACRPMLISGDATASSEAKQERYSALIALAALEADEELVEAIWNSDVAYEPDGLAGLRNPERKMAKEITRRAFAVLTSRETLPEAQLRKAILVAWLSADAEFIAPLRGIFSAADPESLTARYACIALIQLGDQSPEFAGIAAKMLTTAEGKVFGINALVSNGEAGLSKLAKYLGDKDIASWDIDDMHAMEVLYEEPSNRALAVELAARYCLAGRWLFPPYEIAAESHNPKLREKVILDSFDGPSSRQQVTLEAIKGLAKFDSVRAAKAALNGLRTTPSVERQLCKVIVRIAPDTAASQLFGQAIAVERKSLRPAVGRALRMLDPVVVDALLAQKMGDASREIRASAAELAGWLPSDRLSEELDKILLSETESMVRDAILAAFDRKRREVIVLALFEEFRSASSQKRWTLLLAIIDTGDPYLLTELGDSLWIGICLNEAPYIFTRHANQALAARKRQK